MSQTATTINADRGVSRAWRNHLLALGVVLVLIFVEFRSALSAAVKVWEVSPTYSHCFLIIPIVGWLIWEKKAALKAIRPAVAPQFLWFLPPIVLVWWL